MEEKLMKKVDEKIEEILNGDINNENLDHLYKLIDIYKDAKEVKNMNYGNYGGRGYGRENYGNYGEGSYGEYGRGGYGARGRYRGHDHLDRISGEYGRYQESRQRYGASEETDKSYHYMVKALEDFIKVLHEEADTEQQRQMLRETLQRSMM